jgi:alpha-L-fucosidase
MTRRELLLAAGMSVLAWDARAAGLLQAPAKRPIPTGAQLAWQRDELALFIHFGVNTFTDREWGDGREDPAIFSPAALDAGQWARAARAAGFKAMILTAKHHDGFCLWPTRTTRHSVAASPWRGGGGDVVREFVDACRAEGLRPGVYLSPWDRNHPTYGASERYNDVYCDQLTELLTNYGPMAEVWFDGANGEGPNGRRQVYDWPRFWGLVKQLQPEAVIFSDAGPDVRWGGNEAGVAGDPNWSTVNPAKVPYPGMSGAGIIEALQHGDADGSVWRPAESDTSIRPGWFYHPAEDARVKSVDRLVELYFLSVGRNSKLLLNVPPTRDGLLHETDIARLSGMHARLGALFADDLARRHAGTWRTTGSRTAEGAVDLGRVVTVSIVRLEEPIAGGQCVARYSVQGFTGESWLPLSQGTTVGYAKLDRFEPVRVSRVRVVIEDAIAPVGEVVLRVFGPS